MLSLTSQSHDPSEKTCYGDLHLATCQQLFCSAGAISALQSGSRFMQLQVAESGSLLPLWVRQNTGCWRELNLCHALGHRGALLSSHRPWAGSQALADVCCLAVGTITWLCSFCPVAWRPLRTVCRSGRHCHARWFAAQHDDRRPAPQHALAKLNALLLLLCGAAHSFDSCTKHCLHHLSRPPLYLLRNVLPQQI